MTERLETLLDKIREARNFDFRHYKRPTLKRRIERRMALHHCRSLADYLALLDHQPAEFDALISEMLIKLTSFFRDPDVWEKLKKDVLPRLINSRRGGEELRIWSAGCATGEEAYSLAIACAEVMGPAFQENTVKIFGTDVDQGAIAVARRGIYSEQQLAGLSPTRLESWFVKVPEGYCPKKEIRRAVVFGVNNLTAEAPISRLDLILCRNVFIYLDVQLQKRVLSRFHYALRRDGALVLGKSELIPYAARIFEAVDVPRRIYRKGSLTEPGLLVKERTAVLEEAHADRPAVETAEVARGSQLHRDALNSLAQAVIVVSAEDSIVLWNRAAARLWSRKEADVVGKKLPGLHLPGLSGSLLVEKSALVRESKSDREVESGVLHGSGSKRVLRHIEVELTPLRPSGKETEGLVYVARDVSGFRAVESELREVNQERQGAFEALQTTNEELQSTNEELETTNEELQSSNEELQTTNEELQSTNEELETTNEELQSTNAELDATNRELGFRTDELNQLTFYQRTLVRSLSAAVVGIDADGRVTTWNLAAERILGLPEREALGQLLWTLRVPAWDRALVNRMRKSLGRRLALREEVDYEMSTAGGEGHGTLCAIPLVEDGNSRGAVVLFEDTTRAFNLAEDNRRLKSDAKKPKDPKKRK